MGKRTTKPPLFEHPRRILAAVCFLITLAAVTFAFWGGEQRQEYPFKALDPSNDLAQKEVEFRIDQSKDLAQAVWWLLGIPLALLTLVEIKKWAAQGWDGALLAMLTLGLSLLVTSLWFHHRYRDEIAVILKLSSLDQADQSIADIDSPSVRSFFECQLAFLIAGTLCMGLFSIGRFLKRG